MKMQLGVFNWCQRSTEKEVTLACHYDKLSILDGCDELSICVSPEPLKRWYQVYTLIVLPSLLLF